MSQREKTARDILYNHFEKAIKKEIKECSKRANTYEKNHSYESADIQYGEILGLEKSLEIMKKILHLKEEGTSK